MTTKAIATIRNIIEKDTIVQSNLSKYEGEPALTFQTAQKRYENALCGNEN